MDDRGARYPLIDPLVQQAQLTASDAASSDQFGWRVALNGDTALVGAPFDAVGAAYVFTRSGGVWTEQTQLTASDGNFGWNVALSGDTALVGAYLDDVGANVDQGSAFVFVRVASPPATLTLAPTGGTNFVGTQHCVTATVRDSFGNPVAAG